MLTLGFSGLLCASALNGSAAASNATINVRKKLIVPSRSAHLSMGDARLRGGACCAMLTWQHQRCQRRVRRRPDEGRDPIAYPSSSRCTGAVHTRARSNRSRRAQPLDVVGAVADATQDLLGVLAQPWANPAHLARRVGEFGNDAWQLERCAIGQCRLADHFTCQVLWIRGDVRSGVDLGTRYVGRLERSDDIVEIVVEGPGGYGAVDFRRAPDSPDVARQFRILPQIV